MPHPLLDVDALTEPVEVYLETHGSVFARFTEQDSGCRSYGVALDDERWFLKHSTDETSAASLRRAASFHRVVRHPAIVPLEHAIDIDDGLALVYPWAEGEVLYHASRSARGPAVRLDPHGAHVRFRALPLDRILPAIDTVLDAHLTIAEAGFVAVDLYDGCLLYDFDRDQMHLVDLDEYRPGPFVVTVDRLPGSTRFMAPEEMRRGATIDQRTTVFDLARLARVLLDTGDLDGEFRGSTAAAGIIELATRPEPGERYVAVADFVEAWRGATATTTGVTRG
jgi:serine/threonine-protein kinase